MSIICFHGADHKCGVSMISQCVAEALAEKYEDRNVLLVHTESNHGSDYFPQFSESMENIRPYLTGNLVDTEEVMEKARVSRNLSIIGGPTNSECSWDYRPDMTEFFLRALKDRYDYIVCDSGSELEHGLALGSMFAADIRCIVLGQNEMCLRRYEWMRPLYEKLNMFYGLYIINPYSRKNMYEKKYLAARLQLSTDKLITVRESSCGWRAEMEGKSLLNYKSKGYEKDINKLINRMGL